MGGVLTAAHETSEEVYCRWLQAESAAYRLALSSGKVTSAEPRYQARPASACDTL